MRFSCLTLLLAAACAKDAPAAAARTAPQAALVPTSPRASAPTAPPAAPPPNDCNGVGLIPCNVAAAPGEQLCATVGACIEKHGDAGEQKPIFVYDCQPLEALQPSAEFGELAMLRVQADQGARYVAKEKYDPHPNAGEATFLVARHSDAGFCLIDQVTDWDWDQMGRIDQQYDSRVRKAAGQPELLVQVEHVSRMELDQEERESGEDDVRYASCGLRTYQRDGSRFRLTKQEETDQLCEPLRK